MFYLEGGGGSDVTALTADWIVFIGFTYTVLYIPPTLRGKKFKQKYVANIEHLQMPGHERRSFCV